MATMTRYRHIGSQWGRVPTHVRAVKEAWRGEAQRNEDVI